MDVINDRIIDVSLNVLGYLIAGGLGVLLHTVVQQRRLNRGAQPAAVPPTVPTGQPVSRNVPQSNIEFVSFGSESTPASDESETRVRSSGTHRNRREIIRLAREMMEAGTGGDQIRKTLPISQSELALLRNASSN